MARMWLFDRSFTQAASLASAGAAGGEAAADADRDIVSFEDRLVHARTRRSMRPGRPEMPDARPAAETPPVPRETVPPAMPHLPAAGHRGFAVPPPRPVRRGPHPGWALAAGLFLGAGVVLGGFDPDTDPGAGRAATPAAAIPMATPVAEIPTAAAPRPMTAAPVRAAAPLPFKLVRGPRFETGRDPRRIEARAKPRVPEPDALGDAASRTGPVRPVVSTVPVGGTPARAAPVRAPQAPVAADVPGAPKVPRRPAGEPEDAFTAMRQAGEAPAPAPVLEAPVPVAETPLAPRPAVRTPAAPATSARASAALVFAAGPRVYVHVPPGADAAGLRAIAALGRAGYDNVVRVPVPFAVSRSNIRYYHASDRGDADTLQDALASALPGPRHPAARDFTSFDPQPRPGTLEVWIAGE